MNAVELFDIYFVWDPGQVDESMKVLLMILSPGCFAYLIIRYTIIRTLLFSSRNIHRCYHQEVVIRLHDRREQGRL
jgi:hypothetical protein